MTSSRSHGFNVMPIFTAVVAANGGFLFGFNLAVISGVILLLKNQWNLNPLTMGAIVSSVTVGMIVGSAFSGRLADRLGRVRVLAATGVIFVVGAFLTGLALSVTQMVACRIFVGLAIGTATVVVPLYVSEISPPSIRGALVSFNQFAVITGMVAAYLVGAAFAAVEDGWRYMLMVGAVPGAFYGVGLVFSPESPRWLMMRNKESGARRVLRRMGSLDIDADIAGMKEGLATVHASSWSELRQPWLRPALIVGLGLMFFQQLTGIDSIFTFYAPTIFQEAGFETATTAMLTTVGLATWSSMITLIAITLLDRVGRKPLLSVGFIGIVVSLVVLGLGFSKPAFLGSAGKWVIVGGLLAYVASFATGLGPVCGLIVSEIFPMSVRGMAISIAVVCNLTFSSLVAFVFPALFALVGPTGMFWFFAAVSFVGFMFAYRQVPETRGRTLEQIERYWRGRVHLDQKK